MVLISIPSDLLLPMTQHLQGMEWDLPSYKSGRDGHVALEESFFRDLLDETNTIEYLE
jgi:hypothetical protein